MFFHRQWVRSAGLFAIVIVLSACSGAEGRLAKHLQRGEEYFAADNLDKARVEFSNALQIDSTHPQANYFLGRIAEDAMKPRDAVAHYQAALEKDPDLLAARAALGRLFLLGGLTEKAKEVVLPGLEKAPQDPYLRVVRGGWRAVEGDDAGALEDAEAAMKLAPEDEFVIAFLASQYRKAGRLPEAITIVGQGVAKQPASLDLRIIMAELQLLAGNDPAVVQQLKAIVAMRGSEFVHRQRLVRFHLLRNRPADAEQVLREAVTDLPDSLEAKNALVALIANQKGVEAARDQMLAFVKADSKSAELRMALGQFHEQSRQIAEAEAVYQALIKDEGTAAAGLQARNLLAALLVRENRLPEAEKLVAEVLAESPRDNDSLILRAGIALSRNETATAITDLRSVLRDQPDSVRIMRALARAHLQDKDVALAEEALRNAVQIDPRDSQSRLDLAVLLMQSGRSAQATPILAEVARDDPANIAAQEALFRVQFEGGRFEEATATAGEMRKLRPDLAVGALLAGSVLEKTGKQAEAIRLYESSLGSVSDQVPLLTALVRHDIARKDLSRANARLDSQLVKTPQDQRVLNMKGEILLQQRQFPQAQQQFEKAIAAAPKWWVPYRNKARVHFAAGQSEQVVTALEQGVERTGGSLELIMDLATTKEGLKRFDEAIAVYERGLKLHPESRVLANNLAMLLVTHRSDQASLGRAEEVARQLDGAEDAPFLDTLGWVRYHLGAHEAAVALLRRAADKAPDSAEIRYHLGMAQLKAGDRSGARASLESALAANPRFDGAEAARTALREIT
jgi:tetratricopeptide (TPR) repeat protein